jgi:hypothetical protein
MKKFHLVTGNHKTSAGIEDIHLLLSDILEEDLTSGIYADKSKINFVIEDFASQDFTNYMLNSEFKFCLVLTEFMSSGYNGKIFVNKFGIKANPIILFLKDIVIAIVRYITRFLPFKLRLISEEFVYWKKREIGLRRVLAHGKFYGVFCLHPAIEDQAKSFIKNLPRSSFFTLFPRLNKIQENEVNSNISIVSFGSKSNYRKSEILKFNNSFPSKVIQPKFKTESPNEYSGPMGLFIDLYFRNSKSWKYLSPIRFWRTLRKGSFIAYFGEEMKDHPINRCAIRVDSYKDFASSIEDLPRVIREVRNEIRLYDGVAKKNNDKCLSFLNEIEISTGIKDE